MADQLEVGTILSAKHEDGKWYVAQVVAVAKKSKSEKPVKINWVGYTSASDVWTSLDSIRSKKLASKKDVQEERRTAAQILPLLSIAELVGLVSGRDFWHNSGVERFGIPPLRVTDGPFGARGVDLSNPPSALTPAGVALGATWDKGLLRSIGELLGEETKLKGAQILLGPTVNLQRVPVTGRHFECFSEDPELTARLAVEYITGVQSRGVGACVKHFLGNDQENGRMSRSAELSDDAAEYYSLPFLAAIQEAGVASVMAAYNKFNGTFCCESRQLLTDVLRGKWGFDGVVMSDWFAAHSTAASLDAGLDLEMPGWPGMHYSAKLMVEVSEGRVSEAVLRARAGKVLAVMERLGLLAPGLPLTPPEMRPSQNSSRTKALLRRAAAESFVLLRNHKTLPLPAGSSVAVIGPSELAIAGGGSSQVAPNPSNRSLATALRQRGASKVQEYLGCNVLPYLPAMAPPLCSTPSGQAVECELFLGAGWPSGDSVKKIDVYPAASPIFRGIRISIHPESFMFGPMPLDPSQGPFSARMTTTLTAGEAGRYEVGMCGSGQARLRARHQLLIEIPTAVGGGGPQIQGPDDFNPRFDEQRVSLELAADEQVQIVIEWMLAPISDTAPGYDPSATACLILGCRYCAWCDDEALAAPAIAAARESDAAVIVVNSDEVAEAEGRDAKSMHLPASQVDLIKRVAAVNPRTIVCLNVGTPRDLTPFLESVGAVVATWFAGQEAADALAAILLDGRPASRKDDAGYWGPCGHLPMSWPYALADTVAGDKPSLRYPGDAEGTRVAYTEGTLVGYRWFESQHIQPLFPFGFGLSYTTFQFSSLSVSGMQENASDHKLQLKSGSDFELTLEARNIGDKRGKVVAQAYLIATVGQSSAPRRLASFAKISLQAGEAKAVKMLIRFSCVLSALGSESSRLSLPWKFKVVIGSSAINSACEKSFLVVGHES